jgi:cyanophycinase-like exopeptidase
VVDDARPLGWIGIDEQTVLISQSGSTWRVAGRGLVRIFAAGIDEPMVVARAGETIQLP